MAGLIVAQLVWHAVHFGKPSMEGHACDIDNRSKVHIVNNPGYNVVPREMMGHAENGDCQLGLVPDQVKAWCGNEQSKVIDAPRAIAAGDEIAARWCTTINNTQLAPQPDYISPQPPGG